MTVYYTEGTARAVIRGETVVVLPDKTDDVLLVELWNHLAGAPDGVAAALGVLTGVPGGLSAVPPFAVVSIRATGEAHVAVRGVGARVTVRTSDGDPREITGENVISWSEQVVSSPTAFVVTTAPSTSEAEGGFPVESAVVPAAAVRRVLVEGVDGEAGLPATSQAAGGPTERPDESAIFSRIPGVAAPPPPEVPDPPVVPEPVSVVPTPPAPGPDAGDQPDSGLTLAEPSGQDDAPAATADPSVPVEATQIGGDDEYEHLFGATIMRSVEDAAVRAADDEDDEDDDAPAAPSAPSAPPQPPPSSATPAQPVSEEPGIISAIPGSVPGAPSSAATPGGTPAAVHRAAAVSGVAGAASSEEEPDDHDGHTVMQSDLADLRRSGELAAPPAPGSEPGPSVPRGGVEILGVVCPNGHANPPSRSTCRTCADALSGEPTLTSRPKLGRLVVTTGSVQAGMSDAGGEQVVDLDRAVIVGRRPRTSTASASEMPRLVTVASPNQDISRSHLEVTLEEWQVLVADLATTNGTTLIRPGQPPRRLHPNEKEIVVDGDVIDLGDGVTLKFEGIW